jgi:hypothetical protein
MELESSPKKRGSKFLLRPHMDEENIFLERRHVILGYRLIKKVFYDSHVKERSSRALEFRA